MCAFRKLGNSDSSDTRALAVPGAVGQYDNTVKNCIDACAVDGFNMAGVEFARECCSYFSSFP
jgi:hypothetical protein